VSNAGETENDESQSGRRKEVGKRKGEKGRGEESKERELVKGPPFGVKKYRMRE